MMSCPNCHSFRYNYARDYCPVCDPEETCLVPMYRTDPVLNAFAETSAGDLLLFMIALDRKARSQPRPMETHLL